MTDKVQKIREEVERIINRRLNLINGDYFDLNEETNGLTNEIIDTIELLREEPVPQFKVGDTIRSKHWETAVHKIISMDDKSYCLDNGGKVDISSQQLWELVKEPVSEEWIEELRAKLDSLSKEEFEQVWEKYRVEEEEEPVSEELEEAAQEYTEKGSKCQEELDAFKAGANWQKQQMMAKAITAHCFGFQGDALFSFRLPAKDYLVGSNVKVFVIKED